MFHWPEIKGDLSLKATSALEHMEINAQSFQILRKPGSAVIPYKFPMKVHMYTDIHISIRLQMITRYIFL